MLKSVDCIHWNPAPVHKGGVCLLRADGGKTADGRSLGPCPSRGACMHGCAERTPGQHANLTFDTEDVVEKVEQWQARIKSQQQPKPRPRPKRSASLTAPQIAIAETRAAICRDCDQVKRDDFDNPKIRLQVNQWPVYNVGCKACGCAALSLVKGTCPQGKWESGDLPLDSKTDHQRAAELGLSMPQFRKMQRQQAKTQPPKPVQVIHHTDRPAPKPVPAPKPADAPSLSRQQLHNYFDRIVVVNLDRRQDRWTQFQQQLDAMDWPLMAPQRFSATDGQDAEVPEWFTQGKGAWGCYQSHLRLLRQAVADGVQSLLVLEDDVTFVEGFADRLGVFLQAVPDDWDQIYLGGQHLWHNKYPPRQVNDYVIRPHNVNRTHAYALRGKYIPKALAFLEDIERYASDLRDGKRHHVDHRFGQLHMSGTMNVYAPAKWLAGQAAGQSNIKGKVMDEKFWQRNGESPKDKPIIAVFGPYKGGTSCVAGVLHHLGVFMGDNLKGVKAYPNYEDWSIRNLCVKHYPEPALEAAFDQENRVEALRGWLYEHTKKSGDASVLGAKHPILSLMVDELAQAWGPNLALVKVERPVEDTIASMQARSWWKAKSETISRKLVEARDTALADREHVTVNYNALLADPETEVRKLADALDLTPSDEQLQAAIAHVDPQMQNVKDGQVVTDKPKVIAKKKPVCTLYPLGGIGDQLWSRPFVRQALKDYEQVHVVTSWPQMWWDLAEQGVKLVRRNGRTVMHQQNAEAHAEAFALNQPPNEGDHIRLRYQAGLKQGKTLIESLESVYPIDDVDMSMPLPEAWIESARAEIDKLGIPQGSPLAIYRPASVKPIWPAPARNPDPEAYAQVVSKLRQRGVFVLSMAYADGVAETLCQPQPDVDAMLHHETTLETMMGLMALADLLVTLPGVGQVFSLANQRPALCVYGGHIGDTQLADPRIRHERYMPLIPPNVTFLPGPNSDAGDKSIPEAAIDEAVERSLAVLLEGAVQ